ncbi:MAG: glycosyltransferase family 1 protein [bacterium]|nr:glycosyltransferase family 1 protein [bacterium]
MTGQQKIKMVTELRYDAIGIYNNNLIKHLQSIGTDLTVIQFNNRIHKNRYLNFMSEIINTIKLFFLIRRDDIVLFTDTISLNLFTSLFLVNNKYAVFFHYDKIPFYYKFLPFVSYKRTLNTLTGIICGSRFSVSQLDSLGINTHNCKVIYSGIDHDLFQPLLTKLYPFEYILTVGSEEPRKNMKNILKAFQILKRDFPHLKLLKIGEVSPQNRANTLEYVHNLELSESVIFTDYVEEGQLPAIYSNAKLLLFPSLKEGFGLPIVEAMACGCPVVTSNRSPMTELVASKQATINPLNPEEIARECKIILSDDKYRDGLVQDGLARASYFNWEKTAKEVYRFVTS